MPTNATLPKLTKSQPSVNAGQGLWARLLRNGLWIALTIAVILCATELLFAAAHIGEEELVDIVPVVGFWHRPNRFITWRSEGYSQSRTNADGLRDVNFTVEKPAGVRRIAILGDSMTEAYQVDPKDTFVKQLENKLNKPGEPKVQVMNFGMSCLSTTQALYLFKERIARYHPDVCVLAYHVGDNEKNLYAPGADSFMPRPYSSIGSDGQLQTDWHCYDTWMSGNSRKSYYSTEWLRCNSRLWGVLTKVDLQLSSNAVYAQIKSALMAIMPSGPDIRPPAGTKLADRITLTTADVNVAPFKPNLEYAKLPPVHEVPFVMPTNLSKKQAAQVLAARGVGSAWRANLTNSAQRFTVTASLIETLNKACARQNCKLLVAALPAPNNSMLYFRELHLMKKVAARAGFAFVDVNASFPSIAPMQESNLYYNIHFTPKGHALVADTLLKTLQQTELLKSTDTVSQ